MPASKAGALPLGDAPAWADRNEIGTTVAGRLIGVSLAVKRLAVNRGSGDAPFVRRGIGRGIALDPVGRDRVTEIKPLQLGAAQ